MAFNDSGEMWSWGSNDRGQLGLKGGAGPGIIYSPKQLWVGQSNKQASTKVLQVCASVHCTLLLRECQSDRAQSSRAGRPIYSNESLNKQITEVFQWGHGNHTPMRVTFSSDRASRPPTIDKKDLSVESAIRGCTTHQAINIIQLSSGTYHNVALSSAKHVYTWGSGSDVLGQSSSSSSGSGSGSGTGATRESALGHLVETLLPQNGGGASATS